MNIGLIVIDFFILEGLLVYIGLWRCRVIGCNVVWRLGD